MMLPAEFSKIATEDTFFRSVAIKRKSASRHARIAPDPASVFQRCHPDPEKYNPD
jgi:hypothetical protein